MPRGRRGERLSVEPGERFERLVVRQFFDIQGGCNRYTVDCDCGRSSRTTARALKKGLTRSCGQCLRVETIAGRGKFLAKTPTYRSWVGMRTRCYNTTSDDYKNYGARGITICERWRDSFENFLADMGPSPGSGFSVDRYPDNNGNYEPRNCRWATAKQQNNNRRDTVFVVHDGLTLSLSEWAERLGIPYKDFAWSMQALSLTVPEAIERHSRKPRQRWQLKISDDKVREIRADPRPQRVIARELQVDPSYVSHIKSRKLRGDVP